MITIPNVRDDKVQELITLANYEPSKLGKVIATASIDDLTKCEFVTAIRNGMKSYIEFTAFNEALKRFGWRG